MAIICRSYHLLFIMTPRTACSAVGKALREQLDGEFFPSESILNEQGKNKLDKKHNTLQELISNKLLTESEASTFLKFTCVRNPFDSLTSLYEKKRTKYQPQLKNPNSWIHQLPSTYIEDMHFCLTHSFDEWIVKNYKPKLFKRIFLGGRQSLFNQYIQGVDKVMHFENIQRDFQNVLIEAGITQNVSLPNFNQTSQKLDCYREYYSKSSRKIVEYVFNKDLENHGYSF